MKPKKVFVSGCFDLLHSGHIAFLEEAAGLGELYVGLGSDRTIRSLKNRRTVFSEVERLYIMRSIRYVKDAWINRGSGNLDFLEEIESLQPDILLVNQDGDIDAKRELCQKLGIEYRISRRLPSGNLPVRTSTELRTASLIPFRLDIAGGWLDQPFVSRFHPGSVLTISIEPTWEFSDRSGMASSTRKKAIEIWSHQIPEDDPEKLAKILFSFENPPGKEEISGSQDAIGIVFPGLNKLNYSGEYWPDSIESCLDKPILEWLEKMLRFIPLEPRQDGFSVLGETRITAASAGALAMAAEKTWKAIQEKDARAFGHAFREAYEAQVAMFPRMETDAVRSAIEYNRNRALGWKLSGAGGGGYLVVIAETDIPEALGIQIHRKKESGDI